MPVAVWLAAIAAGVAVWLAAIAAGHQILDAIDD